VQLSSIVLVEDDDALADLLCEYLGQHQFRVARERTGDAGVARILASPPDLVILDLFMPGMDGLAVCRTIRPRFAGPVLILTASKSDADHVAGLEIGADDFITKPIDPRILLARIRTLLRRTSSATSNSNDQHVITTGPLRVDPALREVTFEGQPVELTTMEFDVLSMLARETGRVVTREELYEKAAGVKYDGLDRGMDVHVSRIRKKLEALGCDPRRLKSVRGTGYLLAFR